MQQPFSHHCGWALLNLRRLLALLFRFGLALFLVASVIQPAQASSPPARVTRANASDVALKKFLVQWLKDRQYTNANLPSYGGIRMAEGFAIYAKDGHATHYYLVNVYRGCISALGMLASNADGGLDFARHWTTWCFAHLNPQSAPLGAPYDHLYTLEGDGETTCLQADNTTPEHNYDICNQLDATDSAISGIASVLWSMHQHGASNSEFTSYAGGIDQLKTSLLALKDSDGLYWAKTDYKVKFAEDQNEVVAGWTAFAHLYRDVLKDKDKAIECQGYADDLRAKIVASYFNTSHNGLYAWAKTEDGKFDQSNLALWYADSQSQMWPSLWGTVASDDVKTQTVVTALNNQWNGVNSPQWWTRLGTGDIDGGHINSGFAYSMLLAGQSDKISSYLAALKSTRLSNTAVTPPTVSDPFTSDEAGFLLLLLANVTDDSPPTVAIATPSPNQTVPIATFTSINGTCSDDASVNHVTIQLSRIRDGVTSYWNGSSFTSSPTSLPAVLEENNAPSTAWNYPISPELKTALNAGPYRVAAQASDTIGHQSSQVTTDFMVSLPTQPSISVDDVTSPENGTALFTVSLSNSSTARVTVDFATANGSATQGLDFTTTSGTLIFEPGQTRKQISVSIKSDTLDEADETYNVKLSTPINASLAKESGIGTITDDDTSAITIKPGTIVEGNSGSQQLPFTAQLSVPNSRLVSFSFATTDAALTPATAGNDYVAVASGNVSFAPGDTTKTFTLTINGDTLDEPNELVELVFSAPVNASLKTQVADGVIQDDDPPGTVSVSNAQSVLEGNSGTTNAAFTVTMSTPSGYPVKVNYATSDGTAKATSDYGAVRGTLLFNPGEQSKTILVPVRGDLLDEANETFTLALSSPSMVRLGTATSIATVTDDDDAPMLSIASPSVVEGNPGASPRTLNFTFKLSAPSGLPVSVIYQTTDAASNSATAGADYASIPATTLTFSPGQTVKTVNVNIVGDALDEVDEKIALSLSAPTNVTLGSASGQNAVVEGTIVDDDAPPKISVNDVSIIEGNTALSTATFTLALSAPSSRTISVIVGTSVPRTQAATPGTDYLVLSPTTITFAPGQTTQDVSVQVKGDVLVETNETFLLSLSSPINVTLVKASGVGTIMDDDAPSSSSTKTA